MLRKNGVYLPDWLFISADESDIHVSSTASHFNPAAAAANGSAWVSPIANDVEARKKVVVFADWSASCYSSEMAEVCHALINEGFTLYIIKENQPFLINQDTLITTELFSSVKALPANQIRELIIRSHSPKISADELVILDVAKTREIQASLGNEPSKLFFDDIKQTSNTPTAIALASQQNIFTVDKSEQSFADELKNNEQFAASIQEFHSSEDIGKSYRFLKMVLPLTKNIKNITVCPRFFNPQNDLEKLADELLLPLLRIHSDILRHVKKLNRLDHIESCRIVSTDLADPNIFDIIKQMSALREIHTGMLDDSWEHAEKINLNHFLTNLAAAAPHLTRLSLMSFTSIAHALNKANFPNVRYLELWHTSINANFFSTIQQSFPKLTSLALQYCKFDHSCDKPLHLSNSIRRLAILDCNANTSLKTARAIQAFPRLEKIHITSNNMENIFLELEKQKTRFHYLRHASFEELTNQSPANKWGEHIHHLFPYLENLDITLSFTSENCDSASTRIFDGSTFKRLHNFSLISASIGNHAPTINTQDLARCMPQLQVFDCHSLLITPKGTKLNNLKEIQLNEAIPNLEMAELLAATPNLVSFKTKNQFNFRDFSALASFTLTALKNLDIHLLELDEDDFIALTKDSKMLTRLVINSLQKEAFSHTLKLLTQFHPQLIIQIITPPYLINTAPSSVAESNTLNASPTTRLPEIIYGTRRHQPDNTLDTNTNYQNIKFFLEPACRRIGNAPPVEQLAYCTVQHDFPTDQADIVIKFIKNISFEKIAVPITYDAKDPDIEAITKKLSPDHHHYLFSEEIKIPGNNEVGLYSVSVYDTLSWVHASTTNKNLKISFKRGSEDRYHRAYFENTENNPIIKLYYILSVPKQLPKPPQALESILHDINKIATEIGKKFKSADPNNPQATNLMIRKDASALDKIKAMWEQKVGACRHRSGVFEYLIRNKGLQMVAATRDSGAHRWPVVLFYDENQSIIYMQEYDRLGGHPVKIVYDILLPNSLLTANITLPPANTTTPSSSLTAKSILPWKASGLQPNQAAETPSEFLQQLVERHSGKNILISASTAERAWLRQLLRNQCNVFCIDNYQDLLSSLPRIQVQQNNWQIAPPPTGELARWLMKEHTIQPIIYIELSRFTSEQRVRVLSIWENGTRYADGIEVPTNTTVISAVEPNDEVLQDASITSRQQKIMRLPFGESQLAALLSQDAAISTSTQAYPIFINHSPAARELMLGWCNFINGEQVWQLGELLCGIAKGYALFELHGAPDTPEFQQFLNDVLNAAKCNQPLRIHNTEYHLPDTLQFKKMPQAHLHEYATQIAQCSTTAKVDYVVTRAVFNRCLLTEQVRKTQLHTEFGWLSSFEGDTITLLIAEQLNVAQWHALLSEAKRVNKKLALYLAQDVTLPIELPAERAPPYLPHTIPVVTGSKISGFIDNLLSSNHAYVVSTNDVAAIADACEKWLLSESCQHHLIDASELTDESVLYQNHYQLPANSKTFIFNEITSDLLTDLLTQSHCKVILTGPLSADLQGHLSSLFIESGYIWYRGQKMPVKGQLIIVTTMENAKQLQAITTVASYQVLPSEKEWLLNESAHAIDYNQPFTRCKQAQLDANVAPANDAPLVNPAHLDLSEEAYRAFEKNRIDMVLSKLTVMPCLAIEGETGVGKSGFLRYVLPKCPNVRIYYDEAQWVADQEPEIYKILVQDEARLRKDGMTRFSGLYKRSPSYFSAGKDNKMTSWHKVVALDNPLSYSSDRQPIVLFERYPASITFNRMSPAYLYHTLLKSILEKEFTPDQAMQHGITLLSPYAQGKISSTRKLQTDAMILVMQQRYNELKSRMSQVAVQNNHSFLPSRQPLIDEVLRQIIAGEFRKKYQYEGGTMGMLAHGAPGTGKSTTITAVLDALSIPHKIIPASWSRKEKLECLKELNSKGGIAVWDEINSDSLEAEMNTFENLTILATANPATMLGRRQTSAATENRLPIVDVPEYTKEEYIAILQEKNTAGLTNDEIKFYVDDFLLMKQENPTANLRTLLDNANEFKQPIQETVKRAKEKSLANDYQKAYRELAKACNQYYKTRAELYWLNDFFDEIGYTLFSCFGYQTEKQKRYDYLHQDIQQGLNSLRNTKQKDTLSAAIEKGVTLFKPHVEKGHQDYQHTMHALLQNMQDRLRLI